MFLENVLSKAVTMQATRPRITAGATPLFDCNNTWNHHFNALTGIGLNYFGKRICQHFDCYLNVVTFGKNSGKTKQEQDSYMNQNTSHKLAWPNIGVFGPAKLVVEKKQEIYMSSKAEWCECVCLFCWLKGVHGFPCHWKKFICNAVLSHQTAHAWLATNIPDEVSSLENLVTSGSSRLNSCTVTRVKAAGTNDRRLQACLKVYFPLTAGAAQLLQLHLKSSLKNSYLWKDIGVDKTRIRWLYF